MTTNVVNFVLSKDINANVRVRVHELTGISTMFLYQTIVGDHVPAESTDVTDILIADKLRRTLPETDIIAEIYVESTKGNILTVPVIIGMAGEDDIKYAKSERLNDVIQDNGYVKFTPFKKNTKSILSASSSSMLNSASESVSIAEGINEWVQLPIEYSNLPIDSAIVFKFWCYDVKNDEKLFLCAGRSKLFNESATLVGKKSIVQMHPSDVDAETTTNSNEIMLENLENDATRPEWLNKWTNKKLESAKSKHLDNAGMRLLIELETFDVPLVYSDIKYVPITLHSFDQSSSVFHYDQSFNEITYSNLEMTELTNHSYFASNIPFDPDYIRDEMREDPIEAKFRKLERVQHLSPHDKDLKPTLLVKQELTRIMRKQYFEKVTAKERNMVWRYRWYILNLLIIGNLRMNNAVINFIKCVDWNNMSEVSEFKMILASIDKNTENRDGIENKNGSQFTVFVEKLKIVDCLELLSSNYRNSTVRDMAVKRLETARNIELETFMVQLVQNIKNERYIFDLDADTSASAPMDGNPPRFEEDEQGYLKPPVSSGIGSNFTIASSEYQIVDDYIDESNPDALLKDFVDQVLFKKKKKTVAEIEIPSPFINLLLTRVVANPVLTNYFYWNLKVELEDEMLKNKGNMLTFSPKIDGMYNQNGIPNVVLANKIHEVTIKKFIVMLYNSNNGKHKLFELRRQIELVSKLHEFCFKIKVEHRKETTPKKLEILKSLLVEKHKRTVLGSKHEPRNQMLEDNKTESMVEFPKISIPLDPNVVVNGTFYEESTVFKSSLNPLKITFRTTDGGKYPVMYKIGDDLKQDQFISQLISLMEKILAGENMDLKLKPYKILATGKVEGFIQFIPNNSLSHILAKYNNSILLYLQTFNPDPTSHLGVVPQVMDNYIRSCAGYCVVTYILGVGDRHLENLLLSKDGHFFHADFGYILGQDPKPFPPLMKLPVQIIEGMGGMEDVNYKTFCQYCFITYITLRKNAYLILNLVQLMINTSIPALMTSVENKESEKMELLWKVEEKFMLDMNDEEAVLHFQNLIESSVNAVLPVVIDRLHNLAQYWRS